MKKSISIDKSIEESIDFLTSKDIFLDYSKINLKKQNSFIFDLIEYGLNDNILRYIVENFFGQKFINVHEINYDELERLNYGFFYDGDYIVDFKEYYSSSIFIKIKNLYRGKIFNSFIFMEKNQKEYISKQYLKHSKEKNSKRHLKIKSDIIELVDDMILQGVNELFIDTEKLRVEKDYGFFKVVSLLGKFENIKSESIVDAVSDLIDSDGFYKINNKHKLAITKSSDNSVILKRYSFYENKDLLSETQYGDDYIKAIESISGIFILSQDSDYGYYYDLVNHFEEKENKKVLSLSLNSKSNSATKKAGYDENIEFSSVSSYDYLMIEDISLITQNTYDLINYFSSIGKKIIISVYSKDGINSLSNIIYNYSGINKDVLSSNIGGIYHISKTPKLCEKCKKKIKLRDIDGIRERYPEILKRHNKNTEIFIRNENGCNSCISGYKGFIPVEQLIKRTSILSEGVENFNLSRLKDELSSESNYVSIFEKIEPLIFKDKSVSIVDMRDKV